MPDQTPPAPDGCEHLWRDRTGDNDRWCCSIPHSPGFHTIKEWVDGEWSNLTLVSLPMAELLRLAHENAELRAENESLKTQACAFSLDATSAIVARCKREGKLTKFIKKTIELYGQPGGPWNIPSDPGGWLNEARGLIGEPTVSHEETMKEIEE